MLGNVVVGGGGFNQKPTIAFYSHNNRRFEAFYLAWEHYSITANGSIQGSEEEPPAVTGIYNISCFVSIGKLRTAWPSGLKSRIINDSD